MKGTKMHWFYESESEVTKKYIKICAYNELPAIVHDVIPMHEASSEVLPEA